ncbi:MAG: pyruvate dehydrogenase (acetyl-transferring), homodimeric type [Leptospirales bacterium]|nr:pyruvate dehydrogenase (acetyl-transferring), homodimeric type [Leptospirales bacterium]
MSDPGLNKEDLEIQQIETQEWLESLDYVIKHGGPERVKRLLRNLQNRAAEFGIHLPYAANTPYVNTIAHDAQPRYPGNHEIEWRLRSLIRWNAMATVVRANRVEYGIGGHISSFASSATLLEVAFNHFLRGKQDESGGDLVYFQGHCAPGLYARAFLEGRLDESRLANYRRELGKGGGLSSYPHPYCMPDFWEFPTVSMGLGPIMAIYQARYNRYLEDRGIVKRTGKVWAFLGDGETDEPETLGAITLASREKLDNLVFVINCNLQRLDGPVRGNYKIIQELEAIFRGAGWNVIKVIWGAAWDPLLERDQDGALVQRMESAVDGEYQKFSASDGAYIREHFFGADPRLKKMVENMTDEDIMKLNRGGHDPEKVYAAYRRAVQEADGAPTVILAKTIKGYGLGEAGEGKNITHSQKKLNDDELRRFRSRFAIPIDDDRVGDAPFYSPGAESPEVKYLRERREKLGGPLPARRNDSPPLKPLSFEIFKEFYEAGEGRDASTTMVIVRILSKLLRDKEGGKSITPIIPDEARTFGMEALFRQVGIYSHVGQRYEPVDRDTLLYYKEAVDGQILEEGITEAGAMSSFIAAGTSYASHGVQMVPFFLFYSIFGFQRIGDLIWAAGDMGCRGFLIGGTAGRTTLAGEGLQHQDGHTPLLSYPYPHVLCYDPAFSYEAAAIIEEGYRRMFVEQKNVIYYILAGNENYEHPPAPGPAEKLKQEILRGIYLFRKSGLSGAKARVQLFGSGAIMNETLAAAELLEKDFGVAADVWSVTSYKELWKDAMDCERAALLGEPSRTPYIVEVLKGKGDVVIAASDYTKALPLSIARWIQAPFHALGTDGFGRSESRQSLRDYFEVDRRYIALAALNKLAEAGKIDRAQAQKLRQSSGIAGDKIDPHRLHWA